MIDFLMISTRSGPRGVIEIYPKFIIKKSSDLMIRGGDFYAVWLEDKGLWSTDEQDALELIDIELDKYAEQKKKEFSERIRVLHMWDSDSGMIDHWHRYCQKQMRDSFHMLDEKLIFSNTETKKTDYASKKLEYPLESGPIDSYDKLISTLYTPEERQKIEWAIGSIVSGDSKKIQKFMVLYGAAGTGKSTILNIIQKLFKGYYSVFDAKALGSSSNSFALEAFKSNPLIAIQHDGDLSRIEDNTRLNSLVSHEMMTVNEKFKSTYSNKFKCFLFMGTNKPVKITDAKSGLIRRLIDVSPSGNKLPGSEYNTIVKNIDFELGAIASHCLSVYNNNKTIYDTYVPTSMLGASNDFYNFVMDSYIIFKNQDGTSLKAAWEMYKTYCSDANIQYPFSQRVFKEELKNYFKEYKDRNTLEDGTRVRSYYEGFKWKQLDASIEEIETPKLIIDNMGLVKQKSIFDTYCSECPAQYATNKGTPSFKWDGVRTALKDIDSSKLHYVKVPENHIVIDFDIPDKNGQKSLQENLKEACKWPKTYAEVSKSGNGIHLHYIYSGDVSKLSRVYDDHIEIKIFNGKSSLRRKLTLCNNIPIATINSGLPLKGEKNMVNFDTIANEKSLRTIIKRNLNKEYHPGTKPSIDFIYKVLEDSYNSGMKYDVSDMYQSILAFGANSTHQSQYCIRLISKMHFKSEEPNDNVDVPDNSDIVFYDVEVFPNLFLVNWKFRGKQNPVVRLINPTPSEIEELARKKLVGFNCRRYDNHIMYARLMGYNNMQLFNLSQRIVSGEPNCFFGEAYNMSYTDVYDFSSKKQSLKKFEIELGIHHKELGLPWDQPVPEDQWIKVAEYCDNDVLATEAVFEARQADFVARQILAEVAGMTVNDTTNSLTARIIFGKNRNPQSKFNYRDMGYLDSNNTYYTIDNDCNKVPITGSLDGIYTVFDQLGRPYFPGYKFDHGKSMYRDEDVSEGGNVYSEPGMYGNVALLDVESMHPHSVIAEKLFGDEYTKRFEEIVKTRLAIKHKQFDIAKKMLNGALAKYLKDEELASSLAYALKIAINSVYGLTFARFPNPFRDPRNIDNIVAKRGALFMVNLKHEVQKRGYIVAHIKTDSIKIPDADPEIIDFVCKYGKLYGYNFDHEATYDRICLVNDSVYIAKDKTTNEWTATGTQFQVPYVFKYLFTKEPILFEDKCETKSVSSALYLDMNEGLPENEHSYQFIGKVGQFCPIKAGAGGGELLREKKDKDGNIKYDSATGAKDFRWMESEMVKVLNKEDDIDLGYYNRLVDDAVAAISEHGDYEWFVSDEPYESPPWIGGGRIPKSVKIN